MDASIKCKQLGLSILRAIKNLQISIQGIQKKKNSTCGGYDGPRAFAKRGPLTQLEKTPGTLTPPYTEGAGGPGPLSICFGV